MSKVIWRARALADVERLIVFLQERDRVAAQRAAGVLQAGAKLLREFPRGGRPLQDGTGRRELVIPFGDGAYVLRYRMADDGTIVVLRVWHGRENRRH